MALAARRGDTVSSSSAAGGRFIMFGFSAGEPTELSSADLWARSLTASVAIGPRIQHWPGGLRALEEQALAAASAGHLVPLVHPFPLEQAAAAHTALESRAHHRQGRPRAVAAQRVRQAQPLRASRKHPPGTLSHVLLERPPTRRRFAPLETFRSPGYRVLWLASVLWNQARWMDQVVLGWVVLEMTNSAWHVAVIGAIRWLPLFMFGLFGGAFADRFDRRRLLIGAQGVGLVVSLATAALLATGSFDFFFAALVTFLLGLQWAVDWPTRRALIPDLVGRELTVNAVALEAVSMNLTRIFGPLVAGALIAFVSPTAAFVVISGLYVLELLVLQALPRMPTRPPLASGPMLRYLLDGLRVLHKSQAIVGVLLISVFMNVLVFPYQQLLPVFARDVLHVDAIGLGVLGAASGVGSLLGFDGARFGRASTPLGHAVLGRLAGFEHLYRGLCARGQLSAGGHAGGHRRTRARGLCVAAEHDHSVVSIRSAARSGDGRAHAGDRLRAGRHARDRSADGGARRTAGRGPERRRMRRAGHAWWPRVCHVFEPPKPRRGDGRAGDHGLGGLPTDPFGALEGLVDPVQRERVRDRRGPTARARACAGRS